MEISSIATAGTMESSDIMVTVEPSEDGQLHIYLESSVEKQFGNQIRQKIAETLQKMQVTAGTIRAIDKGALDCTVQARIITAVSRSLGQEFNLWKEV